MHNDDPLEQLLDELLEAHDRLQSGGTPESASKATPRRLGRTVVVVSAITLVISTSAVAGILIVTRRSAPLEGALPKQLLGSRYTLTVTPSLRAGDVGWCISLLDIRTGTSVLPTPSTCVSQGHDPLIARGGIEILSPATGGVAGWLLFAIVDQEVAALKAPGGTRILPIASPSLPSNWRAAVTIAGGPSLRTGRATVATLTPIDAGGRVIPTPAAKPVLVPNRPVNARNPPSTGCRITTRRLPGVQLLAARAVIGPLPKSISAPPGFLSCYSLTVAYLGRASSVALLVDSEHPGRRPGNLPGTTTLRGAARVQQLPAGAEGSVGASAGRLIAERVRDAWLVVRTSAPTNVALSLLRDLTAKV